MMSRISNTLKNIKYGYFGTLLTLVLKFISRSVFIYTIGVTYLGVNGLYTNVLSILSFAELGIGTAMNFSLYKPVADNDRAKIKLLMSLYKQAYRWIAFVVAGSRNSTNSILALHHKRAREYIFKQYFLFRVYRFAGFWF